MICSTSRRHKALRLNSGVRATTGGDTLVYAPTELEIRDKMEITSKLCITAVFAALCLPPAVCAATVDLKPLGFKEGMPRSTDTLENSLSSKNELVVLASLVEFVKSHPDMVFDVTGATDENECRPVDCIALSVRRATMVVQYLFDNGVSPRQIGNVSGYGSSWPLVRNTTKNTIEENMRVEIHRIPNPWP